MTEFSIYFNEFRRIGVEKLADRRSIPTLVLSLRCTRTPSRTLHENNDLQLFSASNRWIEASRCDGRC